MQAEGVKLTRDVGETLMSALGRSGLVADAQQLWRTMVWGRATLRPDRRSFLTAIRVFREGGALSQALHAYNGMRRSGAATMGRSPAASRHIRISRICAGAVIVTSLSFLLLPYVLRDSSAVSNGKVGLMLHAGGAFSSSSCSPLMMTALHALMLTLACASCAGFAPSNREFRRLTVACAEAALRSDGAFAAAGDAARAAVALRGQQQAGEQQVDLHGLSATEARVAVLSVLSSIQVRN